MVESTTLAVFDQDRGGWRHAVFKHWRAACDRLQMFIDPTWTCNDGGVLDVVRRRLSLPWRRQDGSRVATVTSLNEQRSVVYAS